MAQLCAFNEMAKRTKHDNNNIFFILSNFESAKVQNLSFPHPCRNKTPAFVFQLLPKLRPHNLVRRVREMRGLLGKNAGTLALAAFVLLQLAVHILYHGVVHGNERETALVAVETHQGQAFPFLTQD